MRAILAIVRKDLRIFLNNRKAVIITLLVPVVIGAFMGSMMGGKSGRPGKVQVPVCVVSLDQNPITGAIIDQLRKDEVLRVESVDEKTARDRVAQGKIGVAVIFPKGFGESAPRSLFGAGEKPELIILHDPSKTMELAMVQGILTRDIMRIVSRETFSGNSGRQMIKDALGRFSTNSGALNNPELLQLLQSADRFMNRPGSKARTNSRAVDSVNGAGGFSAPFTTRAEALLQHGHEYNGYAHSFGGMAVQFVLMFSIETGLALLLERQRGLWKRLRSAPVSKGGILAGRASSTTLISLLTLGICWASCIIFFGVRVRGSWAAFLLSNLTFAIFAASVGLLLAAIGRNPDATRGIAIFVILMMVMLGGAWVPAFIFPEWLQKITLFVPTRWAVDAFDGLTWRGWDFAAALKANLILIGYALLFGWLAVWKFNWEEA
jgi:ABC-2 type transport system permease protein